MHKKPKFLMNASSSLAPHCEQLENHGTFIFYQAFLPCKPHRQPGTKAPCSSVRRSLKRMLPINLKNTTIVEKSWLNSPHFSP